jgi:hypothetical protein
MTRHFQTSYSRLGDGLLPGQESQLQVHKPTDVRPQNSENDAVRDSTHEDESIMISTANFHPLVDPDAKKPTKKGPPKAQQMRLSSNIKSE